jgi:hypothetical protein
MKNAKHIFRVPDGDDEIDEDPEPEPGTIKP